MSKARRWKELDKNEVTYSKAIIYCRVSSDRQRTEGHGLESQEHRCRDFAQVKQYEVVEVFKDSFSGGGDYHDRPGLNELFGFLEKNPQEKYVVLIDDLSRFARDVNAHFLLKNDLLSRDVRLECTNFNFENTPEGELIETLMAAQHQYHRSNNRRQVIQKQRARLEMGYWAFGAKKGYKMIASKEHGKLLVADEKLGPVLKEALEGFADGVFQRKIDVCKFLVEKGFWSKQKPERYIDKFSDLAQDPIHAGYIHYPMWDVKMIEGKHEGIISLKTHNKILKRFNSKESSKRIRVDSSEDFPLRSLIDCDFCERPLTAAWSQGRTKKYPYYFCQNKECKGGRKSINKVKLENEFKILLKSLELKVDAAALVALEFEKAWDIEVSQLEERGAKKIGRKKELEKRMEELTDAVFGTNSASLKKVYEKQLEKVGEELEGMDGVIDVQSADTDIPYRTALDKATTMLKSPYKVWVSLDVVEKQRLFFFIFEEKLRYNKNAGYRTDIMRSYVNLFEEFSAKNSQDVEMAGVEPASELGCDRESTVRSSFF